MRGLPTLQSSCNARQRVCPHTTAQDGTVKVCNLYNGLSYKLPHQWGSLNDEPGADEPNILTDEPGNGEPFVTVENEWLQLPVIYKRVIFYK